MSNPTPRLAHLLRPYRAVLFIVLSLGLLEAGLDGWKHPFSPPK